MMFELKQLPTFSQTITLLHKTEGEYTSKTINNCSVYTVDVLNNNGINTGTEKRRAVDIPCPVEVCEDDYIFIGKVIVDTAHLIEAVRIHKGMKVKTVSKNDRISLGAHMHCEE
jgi:hypothetical protein